MKTNIFKNAPLTAYVSRFTFHITLFALAVPLLFGCATPPPEPPHSEPAVSQTPPPPQQEVVVAAPAPEYVWTPGYWSWQGRWVWIPGRYVVRPHRHAVWVGGHWVRHPYGWVWVGGYWR